MRKLSCLGPLAVEVDLEDTGEHAQVARRREQLLGQCVYSASASSQRPVIIGVASSSRMKKRVKWVRRSPTGWRAVGFLRTSNASPALAVALEAGIRGVPVRLLVVEADGRVPARNERHVLSGANLLRPTPGSGEHRLYQRPRISVSGRRRSLGDLEREPTADGALVRAGECVGQAEAR